jgi:hypothetical protein
MNQNFNEHENLFMAPEDGLFAVVGKAAEREMLKECELWEQIAGDIQIPEETEAQILSLAIRLEKKQLNKKRDRILKRYTKAAAAAILFVLISSTVFFVNADALRSQFFNFIFQDNGSYTKVISVESGQSDVDMTKNLPSDWKEVYYPDYLPEGYEFVKAESAGNSRSITFQNREKNILLLTQEPSGESEMLIDSEGVTRGETTIHGNSAFWTAKGNETTLIWNQYGTLFMLFGQVELDEMIKVADHLLYMKPEDPNQKKSANY